MLHLTFDANRNSVIASDEFRLTEVSCSNLFALNQQSPAQVKTIALGSDRAAKIMAVRASIARVASIDPSWAEATVLARRVETSAPAMPMNDWELMQGARERALAVRDLLQSNRRDADIYAGLKADSFHFD